MRVGIVPSMVPSCDLYRARGPAQVLAMAGEIELVTLPEEIRLDVRTSDGVPLGFKNMPELDVIVFIRGVLPARIVALIPLFQARGTAVVVDVDDDYEHLPVMLQDLYKIHPSLNPLYNWRHVKTACRLADLVTCSTDPLRRYARGSVVLHNCIPHQYLDIGRQRELQRDGLTVGWGGTVYGHPGDLRVPHSGVAEAIRDHGGRFLNVGDGVDVRQDLGLDEDPEVTGIIPLAEYPVQLARLDVAIAPLAVNRYTHCKSALKFLESLSLGSAVVASSTTEYALLQAELDRWCATNDSPAFSAVVPSRARDWRREVSRLLRRSEDERQEASEAARLFVTEGHNMSFEAWRWAEAWERAIKRRKGEVHAV